MGRLRRSLPLAALTARTLGGQAGHWLRLRRAGEDERLAKELALHARQAQRYADLMGGMKGAIMKLRQLLSFVDSAGLIPEADQQVWQDALAGLRADAPPMGSELVAAVIEERARLPHRGRQPEGPPILPHGRRSGRFVDENSALGPANIHKVTPNNVRNGLPCSDVTGVFAEDVVVEAVGDGRYNATLDYSWDLVPLPQGGVVVSFGLRAAAAEIGDPAQELRTCTTVFAGQVAAGELVVEVDVLRRGRSATQAAISVRNAGAEAGANTLAVFGSRRTGPSFVDAPMPDVARPDDCPSFRNSPPPGVQTFPPTPFWGRVEARGAIGHAPWDEYEPTTSDVATWLRFDDPPRLDDGALDPLGVLTLADRMPGCVREKLGPGGDPWFAPSADLTVHLFEPARTEWLLAHDRARWADDGWASAESLLWDENGTLVAYATQMMIFTYLTG